MCVYDIKQKRPPNNIKNLNQVSTNIYTHIYTDTYTILVGKDMVSQISPLTRYSLDNINNNSKYLYVFCIGAPIKTIQG